MKLISIIVFVGCADDKLVNVQVVMQKQIVYALFIVLTSFILRYEQSAWVFLLIYSDNCFRIDVFFGQKSS